MAECRIRNNEWKSDTDLKKDLEKALKLSVVSLGDPTIYRDQDVLLEQLRNSANVSFIVSIRDLIVLKMSSLAYQTPSVHMVIDSYKI